MTQTLNDNNRLPRYRRAEADVSLELTKRDLQILQAVASFRLLSSEHIQALIHGSNQGVLRRLQKLYHAGLLDRLRPRHIHGGGSTKMVYAITNRGTSTLQKEGLLKEVSATDRNASNRDLRRESIDHRLLISHIRAMFTLACQGNRNSGAAEDSGKYHATFTSVCQAQGPQAQGNKSKRHQANPETQAQSLQFLFWREGRELIDKIEVALPAGTRKIPVAADGFFALQDAQGRLNFLIEADRGTMTLKRFTLKLKAYAEYFRQKKQEQKFGIRFFRVLTVTSSAARCQNLLKAAAAEEDVRKFARLFLFTSEEKLTLSAPESVLEKIWMMPGCEEAQALFGQGITKNPINKEEIHQPVAGTL
jgi:predicted transcriptional regulator